MGISIISDKKHRTNIQTMLSIRQLSSTTWSAYT